jgi:membrane-bound lytic murein transglycosylase D
LILHRNEVVQENNLVNCSPKYIIAIFSILLSSCATKAPVKNAELPKKLDEEIVVSSELRQKAINAAREAEEDHDSSAIIGSSVIEKPHEYNKKTYFLYGAEHLGLENC